MRGHRNIVVLEPVLDIFRLLRHGSAAVSINKAHKRLIDIERLWLICRR